MSDCLFCKIIAGDIPADKIYEDDDVLAFHDIGAQAPHHFLVIPKKHIATLNDADDAVLVGKLTLTATNIAKELGFADDGYRVVMNMVNRLPALFIAIHHYAITIIRKTKFFSDIGCC